MSEEQVDLVDEEGRVVGTAPRSVVRRDNLRHAATAVLVRDRAGRIYLHRRSETKDWAPGHWDAAAGGVIRAGEDPHSSAARELEEELGVAPAALVALGTHLFEDETTRCYEYVYEAVWDGPVRHQPEEVVAGRWASLGELADLLTDPRVPFVPDTRQLLEELAARRVGDYGTLDRMAPVSRRDVVILGSTGSIGTQALEVVRANPDRFRVVGLTAGGSQPDLFDAQVAEFAPASPGWASRPRSRRPGWAATWCSTASPAPSGCARPWPRSRPATPWRWPTRSR